MQQVTNFLDVFFRIRDFITADTFLSSAFLFSEVFFLFQNNMVIESKVSDAACIFHSVEPYSTLALRFLKHFPNV